MVAELVAQYHTAPANTDYERVMHRVRVLSIAVAGIDLVRKFPGPYKRLMKDMNRLHGSISDARLNNLTRTLAKHDIHHVATWIEVDSL